MYSVIIDGTRTFLTDCVLCTNDDDGNLAHVTKTAETCVVGINIGKTELTVETEYEHDSIQPECKLPKHNSRIQLANSNTAKEAHLKKSNPVQPYFILF